MFEEIVSFQLRWVCWRNWRVPGSGGPGNFWGPLSRTESTCFMPWHLVCVCTSV